MNKIGVVKEVDMLQVHVVFSDGQPWAYNPDLLQKLDEERTERIGSSSRRMKAMGKFSANDIVKITGDANTSRRLQKEAGL